MGVLDLENIKFSNHPNPEKHYKNIVSSSLWNTLSPEKKEIRAKQIDYLEKDVLAGKAIKIRVKPGFIKFFSKLTGVSDYKGGAWWGDTIYL